MLSRSLPFVLLTSLATAQLQETFNAPVPIDPCASIAGKKWVSPADVAACYRSFTVDPVEQINIVDVVSKSLAFHTSANYQIQAPPPFAEDVHTDVISELSRINKTLYPSDFDLHIDLSRALKKLNDGHCTYINLCYDGTYATYLPLPLAHLTDSNGTQHVHIAPEAFTVAKAEFPDQVSYWQNALPGALKGKLESLSGALVLSINGEDPYVVVDDNAAIIGSYQALGTRQNGFFSSYQRSSTGWSYILGNFAQQSLPLSYEATLTVLPVNSSIPVTFTLPYRSRIASSTATWTDGKSFRKSNCVAQDGTNGVDAYEPSLFGELKSAPERPIAKFLQQPQISPEDARKHHVNVLLDSQPMTNVVLPPQLVPPVKAVNGSTQVSQFYMLNNNTGVLALGSFSSISYTTLQNSLLFGLTNLTNLGATRLIVDVTNNGGGFICIAHWLHRIVAGPRSSTEPNAGLYTEVRAGPLAQAIVKQISAGEDTDDRLLYNPLSWRFSNNTDFPAKYDWLADPVKKVVNGNQDVFGQKLGQECQPFSGLAPPKIALFDPKKVAIVSNGRCASSCSLFSITMAKEDGAKTVVMGGRNNVKQQYCGIVGGQSTDFVTIDTEIKTTKLKEHALAPPDFVTNSVQGITWRLGFGINNPAEPEEWQDHPADYNLPLTANNVNNPFAIWKDVAAAVFA